MVNNKDVTGVTNLTTQQATDIWTGKITNWKDVGGPDEAIVLILRPESSGTRATFKKIVLGGADGGDRPGPDRGLERRRHRGRRRPRPARPASSASPTTSQTRTAVTGLQLDGVDATVDNMANGTYKLQAFGHMYTKGEATGLTKSFLDYILSPDVQNELIPTCSTPPSSSS